jgi:hypothetical protein
MAVEKIANTALLISVISFIIKLFFEYCGPLISESSNIRLLSLGDYETEHVQIQHTHILLKQHTRMCNSRINEESLHLVASNKGLKKKKIKLKKKCMNP